MPKKKTQPRISVTFESMLSTGWSPQNKDVHGVAGLICTTKTCEGTYERIALYPDRKDRKGGIRDLVPDAVACWKCGRTITGVPPNAES